MNNLRDKTIRAVFASISGRTVTVMIRAVSIVVLGRLLGPKDYGLVGMAAAVTGLLSLLGNFGLFQAAIHRDSTTEGQASSLFWINMLLGGVLAVATIALAPALSFFYHEPRLLLIVSASAPGFLLTAAGVQHGAILQRQLRFGAAALIEMGSVLIGTTIAIGMALAGSGYWALVSVGISAPLSSTVGYWLATGWIPGRPRKVGGLRSTIQFGGTMALNGIVTYLSVSFGRIVLGRLWGAEVLGLYDRAYFLMMFPVGNLESTIGEVAFAALSRTRSDPERLKRSFLRGYSLVLALTIPAAALAALFPDELIQVLLGNKWMDAAELLRILSPVLLVYVIANPLGWLMNALGLVQRGLWIALATAPFMIGGALIGLPYGARGVAMAYSLVALLMAIPIVVWAVRGTAIGVLDVVAALRPPVASCLAAATVAYGVHSIYGPVLSVLLRLLVDITTFGAVYLGVLMFMTEQRRFYWDLLRGGNLAGYVSAG
jgi:O-antigen/teichoic acid export membrane protein